MVWNWAYVQNLETNGHRETCANMKKWSWKDYDGDVASIRHMDTGAMSAIEITNIHAVTAQLTKSEYKYTECVKTTTTIP